MYSVGIIGSKKETQEIYKKMLNKINSIPCFMSSKEIEMDKIKDMYIIEDSEENFPINVNGLLSLRKYFTGFIWVILNEKSEEKTKVLKKLYLSLGANGISEFPSEQEYFYLQLKNSLKFGVSKKDKSFEDEMVENSLNFIPENLSVEKSGIEITLTRLEYKLLDYLFKNRGKTITYKEIEEFIWKKSGANKYQVTNLVFNLRKKIETNASRPKIIRTVHSVGYRYGN